MNDSFVSSRVRAELSRVEAERGVRVLYACESGSRAWGFASRDSDWDVRFLYVHQRDWYLSVENRRDVVEQMLDEPFGPGSPELDLGGWELRKALRLLRKSNPPLLEWLKSPLVYAEDARFYVEFDALASGFYSRQRCFAHYLHMARGNWRDYLAGRDEVRLKKYLYVFRPLLACRWLARDLGQPPMLFSELLAVLEENEVRAEVDALVARKQAGDELDAAPPVPVLHEFLAEELPRLEAQLARAEPEGEVAPLDRFLQRWTEAAFA
jgi:uncharacterized protein